MTSMAGLSHDDVRDRFADVLRAMVGQGRRYSWAMLAVATGDNERTLRSYVESGGDNNVPLHRAMRVLTILGAEAWDMMLGPTGLGVRPVARDDTACARRALTGTTRLAASLSEKLEDGRIDHVEAAELQREAAALMPTIAAIAGGCV